MALNSKGQVFMTAAVILSSLLVLVFISFQQTGINDSGPDTRFYFQNILEQQPVAFNQALEDDYSVSGVRNSMYGFNSFVKTQSSQKNTNYSAFQLMIMPEKDSALMINYREEPTDYSFHSDSWNNGSIDSKQYRTISVAEDVENYRFESSALDVDEDFMAPNPAILAHVQLRSDSTVWRNYILR